MCFFWSDLTYPKGHSDVGDICFQSSKWQLTYQQRASELGIIQGIDAYGRDPPEWSIHLNKILVQQRKNRCRKHTPNNGGGHYANPIMWDNFFLKIF